MEKKLLFTLNTGNNFMDIIYNPFAKPYLENHPEVTIYNIMDDSLLVSTLRDGGVSDSTATRMLAYAKAAQEAGADAILSTCTSVNLATEYIKPFMNIPIINIEEPVAEAAIQQGKKIGIIGTIPSSPVAMRRTVERKAKEAGVEVEIINYVADGAYDCLLQGDRPAHDRKVQELLYQVCNEVDTIVFAQISMSLLPYDAEKINVPINKIGVSGFERIHELMMGE